MYHQQDPELLYTRPYLLSLGERNQYEASRWPRDNGPHLIQGSAAREPVRPYGERAVR